MSQTLAAVAGTLSIEELKSFASTTGSAVTIYTPRELPGGPNRRLATRLNRIAKSTPQAAALEKEADAIEAETPGGATLAVFISGETVRHYWLPLEVKEEEVQVADNFQIRKLLPLLTRETTFHILALSQNDVRLLRCTDESSEEVPTGGKIPVNLLDFAGTDQPDHNLRNASANSRGPAAISFGTLTEKEHKDQHLWDFYTAINRGINDILRNGHKTPLVIAGVEFEISLYRKVNTYPNLCAEAVHGAANGLKGGELHSRALECLKSCREQRITELLAQHDKQTGGLADATVPQIVKAAHEGRVAHLLIGETAEAYGNFDEATYRVHQHQRPSSGDEDLLNAAAVQTILHGGDVYVLPNDQVPGNRPAAAVMRY